MKNRDISEIAISRLSHFPTFHHLNDQDLEQRSLALFAQYAEGAGLETRGCAALRRSGGAPAFRCSSSLQGSLFYEN